MFGVGPFELLLIVVVVIVIYGPKQLPEVMKQAARFLVQARRYSNDMRGQFNEVMRQVEKDLAQEELEKLRKELRDVTPKIDLNASLTTPPATPVAGMDTIADAHHTQADHSPDHGGGMAHPPGMDPMFGGVASGGHNPNDHRAQFDHRDLPHEPTAHQPTVAPNEPSLASAPVTPQEPKPST